MFSICVKPSARKRVCSAGLIWVKDMHHKFYVSQKERGEWATREEAYAHITELHEIVVEVNGNEDGFRSRT